MIQKIKNYLLIASTALMVAVPALAPVAVSADCTHIGSQVAAGAGSVANENGGAISCTDPGTATNGISSLAAHLVNIFSIIVGIVAVIMIIYGGFRYITSGGDSGSVGNAKNTLIYAIVGLIIVALAQVIVRFVLSSTSSLNS